MNPWLEGPVTENPYHRTVFRLGRVGREITRQETEDVLKASAKAGLVHAVSNWTNGPDTI